MECKIAQWNCAYHSCTTNDCQYEQVKKSVGARWVRRCDTPEGWHIELCKACKWHDRCPISAVVGGLDYVAMECLCYVKYPEKYITLFPNERKYIML